MPAKLTVPVDVVEPNIAPGPVQEYDTGVIVVDADIEAVVVVHVIDPEFDTVTTGVPILGTTDTVPEFVQLLNGLVTVNVYVFGEHAVAV